MLHKSSTIPKYFKKHHRYKNTCFKIVRGLLVNLLKNKITGIKVFKKMLIFYKKPLKVNYFL